MANGHWPYRFRPHKLQKIFLRKKACDFKSCTARKLPSTSQRIYPKDRFKAILPMMGESKEFVTSIFLSIHILSKRKSKVLLVPLCSFRLFEWLCFGTRLSLFRICPVAVSQSGHRYRLNFNTALNIGNHKRCYKSKCPELKFSMV